MGKLHKIRRKIKKIIANEEFGKYFYTAQSFGHGIQINKIYRYKNHIRNGEDPVDYENPFLSNLSGIRSHKNFIERIISNYPAGVGQTDEGCNSKQSKKAEVGKPARRRRKSAPRGMVVKSIVRRYKPDLIKIIFTQDGHK